MRFRGTWSVLLGAALATGSVYLLAGGTALAAREHGGEPAGESAGEHAGRGMGEGGAAAMSMRRHRHVMRNGLPDEYRARENPLPATDAHLATGQRLYEDNCAACHGSSGRGDGPAAANLDPRPTNIARFSKGRMASDAYMFWTIAEGGEPVGSAMPAFGSALSEEEIWQLVLYLRRL